VSLGDESDHLGLLFEFDFRFVGDHEYALGSSSKPADIPSFEKAFRTFYVHNSTLNVQRNITSFFAVRL